MSRDAPLAHQEALPHLPDFVCGRVPVGLRPGLEAHLEACEECRGLAESYRRVAGALGAEAAAEPTGHPSGGDIVSYAAHPDDLPRSEADRITAHLRDCPSCAEEVGITRRADRATRSAALGRRAPLAVFDPGRWSAPAFGSLAAAIVAGVLGYPVFLGLVRLPEVQSEVETLRTAMEADRRALGGLQSSLDEMRDRLHGLGSWTGPVDLAVLEGPARSRGPEPIVRIEAGQPFALVGVLPPLPAREGKLAGGGQEAAYLFEVLDAGPPAGTPVWSARMTAAEIRARLDRAGVVTFLIPADLLPPGRHQLRFRRAGAVGEADLLSAPFTVAR